MHQYYDDRGDQEGGEDAENDHEGQDVLVETGGVGLAHCILTAGWLAFWARATRLTRVLQASWSAVVRCKTVETQCHSRLVIGVEAHLTAIWLTIEGKGARCAYLKVCGPGLYQEG